MSNRSDPLAAVVPVPKAPASRLFGNLPDMLREPTLVQSLTALAAREGPLVELSLPDVRAVCVSGYRYAREIWDDARFSKKVVAALERLRPVVGDGLFTAHEGEPNWQLAHDLLMPAFGFGAIRRDFPHMIEVADQLTARWAGAGDRWLDVSEDMTRLTLDTIALCAFGARLDSFASDTIHPFVGAMSRALDETQRPLPEWVRPLRFGARRRFAHDVELMNTTVDDIIRERRAQGGGGDDLLGRMLDARHPETGETLDDVNIRYQAITFMIAGHETTSGLLSFALHLLLEHPRALERARAEVDRVLGTDPEAAPTWQQISELHYVRQVLRESLRLYPTAPFILRGARAPTVIGGRYRIETDQALLMMLPTLHRDPEAFGPNAGSFDPEHFSKAAIAARPPHAFKGFGSGVRACIGSQFAMVEATLVLGRLLQRFELFAEPDYALDLVQTLTIKPGGFRLRVEERRHGARAVMPSESSGMPSESSGMPSESSEMPSESSEMPSATTERAALTVLFGSNLGTAEALAGRLADTAEARGMTADLRPLDSAAGGLPDGDVAIVCSTYNGLPPDNARAFVAALGGLAASGRRYAVFGCGHSDWSATFQAVPRRIDAALAERGGVRLLAAGEGDAAVDVEGAFEVWSAGLFTALGGQGAGTATDPAEPRYTIEIGPPRPLNPIAETLGAAPMRVLVNRELQSWPEGHPGRRRTRHIELALPEGVRYRTGDHLGVVPLNDPARVRDAARRLGHDPAVTITLRTSHRRAGHLPVDRPVALGEVLAACVELDEPAARRHVEALAAHSPCPHTRRELGRLSGEAHRAEVLTPRLSILDLLQRFTACRPPLEVFLSLLPPLRPRYYSISSSPATDADRCSVTVAVLEAPALGGSRLHRGVCSTHLARAPVGGSVLAFVRDTGSDFRPPADAQTPMLMIGAGTGLAPYRGFLAERAALVDRGVSVGEHALFFGCRHPDRDLLYRPLLDTLAERDLLTLHPAFSRLEGQPKMYVQQRIEAEADTVWDLIERGAVIYVCGDAAAMEPGVRAALQAVYRARTGATDGAAWLDGLRAAGRYRTDVWA